MPNLQIPAEVEIARRNPKVDLEWVRQAEDALRESGFADAFKPHYRLSPALGGTVQGKQQTILNECNQS